MDARLKKLIADYQARVADAVAMLEAAGIPRPPSTMAWTQMTFPGRGELPSGFTYYKHGFGCAVVGSEWSVDFDFGEHGEIDGFDAYRLYNFGQRRLNEYGFSSEAEVNAAVKQAHSDGDLTFSGYILFYVTPNAG